MNQKKALFVDDDKFLLDMYALKFAKAGYDVKISDTAAGALALVRGGYVPDVMLVDIVMPVMDGLEMVAALRSEKLAPGAAVIFLTNQGEPDDISRARKLGADGYIVKATTIPSEVLAEADKIIASTQRPPVSN